MSVGPNDAAIEGLPTTPMEGPVDANPEVANLILAAGGVVWRSPALQEVAIVHKPEYGDWSLPKGKIERGESLEEAALREIKEEIAIIGKIVGFIGMTNYMVGDHIKLVFYWEILPVETLPFTPSEEVDRFEWVSLAEALRRIGHMEQKALLTRYNDSVTSQGLRAFFGKLFPRHRYRRLIAAIDRAQSQLTNLAQTSGTTHQFWIVAAHELIKKATSVAEINVDQGWNNVQAADRMMIFGYDKHALSAKILELQAESTQKLRGWRAIAIQNLLGKDQQLENDDNKARAHVYLATEIRDESNHNQYFSNALRYSQLAWLLPLLIAIISIFLWLAHEGQLPSDLFNVALFGGFGGIMSTILTIGRTPPENRIPEQLVQYWVTLMRPLLGAAAALVVYFFIQSKIISFGDLSTTAIFIYSFVAGFSERLILGAVQRIEQRFAA